MPGTSSVDDELFDQALHWILQLDESPLDPAIDQQFRTWLSTAPDRHCEAMTAARAFLAVLQQPAIEVGDALDIGVPSQGQPTVVNPATLLVAQVRRRRRWRYATAASITLALAVGSWLGTRGGIDRLRSDAYTQIGQVHKMQLEDGSTVTLNTDTAIVVRLEKDLRSVRLLRGEAYFKVARDPQRPFVVDSAGGRARVLGTAFNVHLVGDSAQVSVIEGRVSVTPPAGGAAAILFAGQSARLADETIQHQADRDPLEVTAWQRRQLTFYNTPLSQVVQDLSRYRHGLIFVRGEDARRMPVSGMFSVSDPDAGLRTLLESLRLDAVDFGLVTVIYRPATGSRSTDRHAESAN